MHTTNEPSHRAKHVLFCRLSHRVLFVVGKGDHILSPVPMVLDQIRRHVTDIVDTSSQLSTLTKVVDANQQGFPPS